MADHYVWSIIPIESTNSSAADRKQLAIPLIKKQKRNDERLNVIKRQFLQHSNIEELFSQSASYIWRANEVICQTPFLKN